MSQLDDLIEKRSEDFVRFLVSGNGANGQDVRVSGVVNAGLNYVIDRESIGS